MGRSKAFSVFKLWWSILHEGRYNMGALAPFDMLGRSGKFPPDIFETVSTEMQSGATWTLKFRKCQDSSLNKK